MAYVPAEVARATLSDMQTQALLLPPPGHRWTREDRDRLNLILAIATRTLLIAAGERKADG